jgi:hypothetical protein
MIAARVDAELRLFEECLRSPATKRRLALVGRRRNTGELEAA